MNASTVSILTIVLLGCPLLGTGFNMLMGSRCSRSVVGLVANLSILSSFLTAIIIFGTVLSAPDGSKAITISLWNWLDLGNHNLLASFEITIDALSAVMFLVVTGVGLLIHIYSIDYMNAEEGVARFFSYMNLFIFSMLVLVVAANLIFIIVGWALVAVSSYLLIGFHYERPSAVLAARKAFIVQVIGDVALVFAAFLLFIHSGSLSLPIIFDHISSLGPSTLLITGICLLLAIGAFAKSAQFPLHTWLPDAMEGPTPVSALIHAATMVTAGVYLIARFHPLFNNAPIAQGVVACVGIGTAIMAGIIALSQIDIKKVIAYSTMSQIGLMIFAVGIGAYTAAIYHLVVHAVFKALLFLAAGNVIHALHDEQDIRLMGGLSSTLRKTEICFLSGAFALAGIFPFAGFFSKETILGLGLVNGPGSVAWLLYLMGLGVNVLTGLYIFRLWAIVFRGEPRTARSFAAHEAPRFMLVPTVILAILSLLMGFFLLWPLPSVSFHPLSDFLDPVFHTSVSTPMAIEPSNIIAVLGVLAGLMASLIGIGLAIQYWLQQKPDAQVIASRLPRFLPQLSLHAFYFDELYNAVLIRPTKSLASTIYTVIEPNFMDRWITSLVTGFKDLSSFVREWQTGYVRDYVLVMVSSVGIFALAIYVVVK